MLSVVFCKPGSNRFIGSATFTVLPVTDNHDWRCSPVGLINSTQAKRIADDLERTDFGEVDGFDWKRNFQERHSSNWLAALASKKQAVLRNDRLQGIAG